MPVIAAGSEVRASGSFRLPGFHKANCPDRTRRTGFLHYPDRRRGSLVPDESSERLVWCLRALYFQTLGEIDYLQTEDGFSRWATMVGNIHTDVVFKRRVYSK
jgi:hypothetical protein